MHTTNLFVNRGDEHIAATVRHNGDYSGDATVSWKENGKENTVELPADLLIQVGKRLYTDSVRDELIRCVESSL